MKDAVGLTQFSTIKHVNRKYNKGLKLNYFMITGYFIAPEQYFIKKRKAYEEMKVFLSAFRLLSN